MSKSYQANRLDGCETLATLTIIDPRGKSRERKLASVGSDIQQRRMECPIEDHLSRYRRVFRGEGAFLKGRDDMQTAGRITATFLTVCVLILSSFPPFLCAAPCDSKEGATAAQIMSKSYQANKLDGCETLATLTIINSRGKSRERKLASVTKLFDDGKTEKGLIRFLEPPDLKGTGLLTFDYESRTDDVSLYLPALRKTRRILAAEKATSFMGSEFSYADLTPPPVEGFHHGRIETRVIRGVTCWGVESTPGSRDTAEENGFSRKISYIGQEDFTVRRATYYDLSGNLHKQLEVLKVREIDKKKHRFRALHLVMKNLQNGRRSVMKVHKIRFRPNVPDHYFTIPYLERE
jgi:hypothetical protein